MILQESMLDIAKPKLHEDICEKIIQYLTNSQRQRTDLDEVALIGPGATK